ncbi:hypothetical protein [Sphingomonas sp. M1-B02]|uniref:hypothetical protein n=1 Tax=Sphingomonas sp. M1-B02 TaxID=3114300 RepID=UPI0022402AEA|nr:hypothetical protein [Sphingomonas sp. S6-11]UZK64947.1 hypothetical protein OKW87_10490 [Sphingomonas sp. S6-11]
MPKTQLDWLGVTALWVGAMVEAVKAGGLPLMTGAPAWLASNIWGYVPAILVSFYIVVALYRLWRPNKAGTYDSVYPVQQPVYPGKQPVKPDPEPQLREADTKGRTFLSSNMTPQDLMDMCANKTDAHAERIVAPYIGKWYRYSGLVHNVIVFGRYVQVRFEVPDLRVIKANIPGNLDLADVLHKGDKLEVAGRISEIDSVTFALADAEVIAR